MFPPPPPSFLFFVFWVNKTLVPESIRKFPPQKKGCCGLRIEKGKEKGKKNAEIYMSFIDDGFIFKRKLGGGGLVKTWSYIHTNHWNMGREKKL